MSCVVQFDIDCVRQNYRCDDRDVRRDGVRPSQFQFPAQSVSHYRWLGEDARGKDVGANVSIEFGSRRATCGWLKRCGGNTCADRPEAPILEFDHSGKLVKSFGAGMFVVPARHLCG